MPSSRNRHIDVLDGLRAVACLIVVVMHTYFFSFGESLFELGRKTPGIPKIGVWLFFALSAFLLTVQLLDPSTKMRDYAIGRALRILPPFAVAVIVYRYVGTLGIDDWPAAWRIITLQETAGHLWTIPVELSFYVLLPFLTGALVLTADRYGSVAAIGGIVAIVFAFALIWPPLDTPTAYSAWCGWYMANFASGVIAAYAITRLPHLSKFTASLLGLGSVALMLAYVASVKVDLFPVLADTLLTKHFVFGPLWAVVIYSVCIVQPAFLTAVPLRLIGKWAFSIYLFHWAVATWSAAVLTAPFAFIIGLGASIIAGYLGYTLVERPTYSIRRWLASGPQPKHWKSVSW